jgi:hypothetical protein
MRERWDGSRREWDDFHVRNQRTYCLEMKRLGPSFYTFACVHISKRRAEFRRRLRDGMKAERLVMSDFRRKRRFLPKDRLR